MSYQVVSESETQALARDFCRTLITASRWPQVVYLTGDLGAGKSVFARAVLQGLGVNEVIKSPTYTLIEHYSPRQDFQVAHLDLYRMNDPEELYYIGFDDVVLSMDLMLIEWPEKGQGQLPKPNHDVIIEYAADARIIQIISHA